MTAAQYIRSLKLAAGVYMPRGEARRAIREAVHSWVKPARKVRR